MSESVTPGHWAVHPRAVRPGGQPSAAPGIKLCVPRGWAWPVGLRVCARVHLLPTLTVGGLSGLSPGALHDPPSAIWRSGRYLSSWRSPAEGPQPALLLPREEGSPHNPCRAAGLHQGWGAGGAGRRRQTALPAFAFQWPFIKEGLLLETAGEGQREAWALGFPKKAEQGPQCLFQALPQVFAKRNKMTLWKSELRAPGWCSG